MKKPKNKKKKSRKNPELLILVNPLKGVLDKMKMAAIKAYQRFHWRKPAKVDEVKLPDGINAKYLIKLGDVDEIMYCTDGDSERTKISDLWKHSFNKKPVVCTTPKGDVLIIMGAKLKVTPRGIEG